MVAQECAICKLQIKRHKSSDCLNTHADAATLTKKYVCLGFEVRLTLA